MTRALEPATASHAAAEIAGITMRQAYRRQYGFNAVVLVPTNLYRPGHDFDLETTHVIPALTRRCREGTVRGDAALVVRGTGTPRKLRDVGRVRGLGRSPRIGVRDGLRSPYEWFVSNEPRIRR